MERTCEFCGASFDGAPQARYCSDAHRQAARRQDKSVGKSVGEPGQEEVGQEKSVALQPDGVTPVPRAPKRRDQEVVVAERPTTLRGLIAQARAGTIVLTAREEDAIRRHYGYSASEKRTLLQRDAIAARISMGVPVVRVGPDGMAVEEPLGPAGLSLTAFPNQVGGDLTPTPEQVAKLG